MKLLIILSSNNFDEKWSDNIKCLNDYMKNNGMEYDYCGISSKNDFYIYENIIQFKYKIINTNKQLSKMCDFITEYKSELDYDWYMKIRPDIKLFDNIDFSMLPDNAINARARAYTGPRKIEYGMSINGEGIWKNVGECHYADYEKKISIDDMLYIFHKNIVQNNAFEIIPISIQKEDEWFHTCVFNQRKIRLNVIGINLCITTYGCFSGNINM